MRLSQSNAPGWSADRLMPTSEPTDRGFPGELSLPFIVSPSASKVVVGLYAAAKGNVCETGLAVIGAGFNGAGFTVHNDGVANDANA